MTPAEFAIAGAAALGAAFINALGGRLATTVRPQTLRLAVVGLGMPWQPYT